MSLRSGMYLKPLHHFRVRCVKVLHLIPPDAPVLLHPNMTHLSNLLNATKRLGKPLEELAPSFYPLGEQEL